MAAAGWGALAAGLGAGLAAGWQRDREQEQRDMYANALKGTTPGTTGSSGAQTMTGNAPVAQPGQTLPGGFQVPATASGSPQMTGYAPAAHPGQTFPGGFQVPGGPQYGPPAPPAIHPAVHAAAAAMHPAWTPSAVVPGTAEALRASMPSFASYPSVWRGGSAGPYGVQGGPWGQGNVPLNVGQGGSNYPNLNMGTLPLPTLGPGRYPPLPSYSDATNPRPLYPGY